MAKSLEALGMIETKGFISLVEAVDAILAGADADLARPVVAHAKKMFKEIRLKTQVAAMATEGRQIEVTLAVDGTKREERYDRVLVAVGRRPNGKLINAEAAGVAVNEAGFIPVDEKQRTNVPHIYAIGDIVG